ncbi:TonB-dependent receptor [Hymenobacter sp. AT01-02]|uniref:TonB-dependent receptor n=1 Tax=Hymenobacter sp. AT01-02 TaxID=1571877 RepID=UPI0006E17491|nr:TonB-dependent receptor plug domain-containing protein [Hymenobacter sp. AT01-02]
MVAHVRGQIAYLQQGEVRDDIPLAIRISKSKCAAGIVHFTVFDSQRAARCERLTFADTAPGLHLVLEPSKKSYAPREQVTLRVRARDAQGRPAASSFSLAVTNAALAPLLTEAPNIRTSLLLTSDLRGQVEQPGYYFQTPSAATARALDDLLLTQGWRRFVWQPVLAGQLGSFPYLHEQGLSMRGSVVDSRKLRVPGVPVVLTRFHPTGQQQVTSDAEGHFVFADFTSRDSTPVKIEALPMRKVRHPQLLFDTDQPALVTGVPPIPLPLQPNEAGRAARLASVKSMSAGSMAVAGGQGVVLGNVTVHGTKAVKPDNRRIYSRADAVIQTKDIAGITTYRNVIEVLQGRVAGVSVVANQGFVQITMRGTTSIQQMRLSSAPSTTPTSRMRSPTIESSPSPNTNAPLLLLDGVATDITMINSVPLADLETIEVLRTNSAAIYGERAAAGAIAFFTKHANPNYDPASEASVVPPMYVPPRYYQARTFYQPAYSSSTPTPATDQRGATLYWSPNVRTDANGQATVSFYCGDTPGTFLLVLEGLSRTGSPGRGTATLQVTAAK